MATFHITHHQTGNTFLAKFPGAPTHTDMHAAIAQYERTLPGADTALGQYFPATPQSRPAPQGVTSKYFTGLPDPNEDDSAPAGTYGSAARGASAFVLAPVPNNGAHDATETELAAALIEQNRREALAAAGELRRRRLAHGHR